MIGVLAKAEEHPWVREFFELFKTPWEFYQVGRQYDVVLCATDDAPEDSARLLLVCGSAGHKLDPELKLESAAVGAQVTLDHDGERIPIYGSCRCFAEDGEGSLRVEGKGRVAVVARRRGSESQHVLRVGFDLFQEVRHLLTQGQPREFAQIPTLDWHIARLRNWIVGSDVCLVEIPPVPQGHRFIACLTHDMDHPAIQYHKLDHTTFGFLQRALIGSVAGALRGRMTMNQLCRNWFAVLKLPLIHLGLAKDFWRQTDRYLQMERGMASTFFVVPTKNDPGREVDRKHAERRATRYEAADVKGELRKIAGNGSEVGVHGIDAWLDADSGRRERAKVAAASGKSSNGVRMHWLCFGEQSPLALEAAGYSYDSTIGYNECVGCRAGTLQVYRPAGAVRLLELPLHIMDTALFYPGHMDLSPKQAAAVVNGFLGLAVRYGGVLTINWHDRSIAPERLWDGAYLQLLAALHEERAWCPTANQAVEWFRKRRSAVFECVKVEGAAVRLKIVVEAGTDALPGLRIRIHWPGRAGAGSFEDIGFSGPFDGTIAEPERN